jgi:hypothetical protein
MVGQSIMVFTLQDLDANVISRNVPNELTFFQLGIKSNFLELVQNISYISFTFLHVLGENENVINVTTNEIIQVLTKKSFMEHGKMIGDHNVFGMMSSIHHLH